MPSFAAREISLSDFVEQFHSVFRDRALHRTRQSALLRIAATAFGHQRFIFYTLTRRAEKAHVIPARTLGLSEQSEFRGLREMIRKGGFMLIEFLAVVALSTILAVVVPRIAGAALRARSSALAADSVLAHPITESFQHNDRLPAATGELGMIYPNRLGRVFKIQTQPGLDKI